jgi:hypothetical protein
MLTSVRRWLGSWVGSEPDAEARSGDEDTQSDVTAAEETLGSPYQPSIADVLVVKSMLTKGLQLPLELVESIVDQAEYWPHTTTEVNYAARDDYGLYTVGFSETSNDSENELLVSY